MNYTEDHIVLAAEYALGSLNTEERAQVETMMAVDEEFAAVVQAWEFRLGVLNQLVEPIEPPASVWTNIVAALTPPTAPDAPPLREQGGDVESLPKAAPLPAPVPVPAAQPEKAAEPSYEEALLAGAPRLPEGDRPALQPEIEPPPQLPMGVDPNAMVQPAVGAGWRIGAVLSGVIAVMLGVVLALQSVQNDTQRAAPVGAPVAAPASASRGVALLRGAGTGPVVVLLVDKANNLTVRSVDTVLGPGKAFQLWLTSDKLGAPRSLGVIGAGGDFKEHEALGGFDAETINSANYRITLEKAGGSPSGQPTSPAEFTGKMIDLR